MDHLTRSHQSPRKPTRHSNRIRAQIEKRMPRNSRTPTLFQRSNGHERNPATLYGLDLHRRQFTKRLVWYVHVVVIMRVDASAHHSVSATTARRGTGSVFRDHTYRDDARTQATRRHLARPLQHRHAHISSPPPPYSTRRCVRLPATIPAGLLHTGLRNQRRGTSLLDVWRYFCYSSCQTPYG